MGFASSSGFAAISTGDISVAIDPATNDNFTVDGATTSTNFTITAGALKAYIRNDSISLGGAAATATVNGIDLPPGDFLLFEVKLDPVTNEYKKVPALVVVTNGATIKWYEER